MSGRTLEQLRRVVEEIERADVLPPVPGESEPDYAGTIQMLAGLARNALVLIEHLEKISEL